MGSVIENDGMPILFYDEDLLAILPNYHMVRAVMANFVMHRILVDQGASCNIMFSNLFKNLSLSKEGMSSYNSCDLTTFNRKIIGIHELESEVRKKEARKCQIAIPSNRPPFLVQQHYRLHHLSGIKGGLFHSLIKNEVPLQQEQSGDNFF